eukprot:CAMPEP_0178895346 /NCGR_PEP_ID=MMETSP0786-20121207/537_1 /TAXON_ID=186022 /ORGANISM="Thalassionema frauenfeldii, Strain CCMP 1798" /LENGTH=476 /DNA_ID=CAMNT_0020565569 /DNA_START=20 /DNA_END=1447 /DNA_ORIENTATION=+
MAQYQQCENKNNTHAGSVVSLCTCTFVQAYLLISLFPYAGFMSMQLIPTLTEDTAGTYAGLIASAFMVGRAVSAYPWGIICDIYGRKPALIGSLVLSALFSFLFGISTSFLSALMMRFCLGFCNSLQATVKTVVTEIAKGDERLEARGTGLVVGMRGIGLLLSPAIGGLLANPMKQYPDAVPAFSEDVLSRFPYFLPNLIGSIFCILSALSVEALVEETLVENRSVKYFCGDIFKYTRRKISKMIEHQPSSSEESQSLDVNTNDSHGTMNQSSDQLNGNNKEPPMAAIWRRDSTRHHLMAYWLFSFVVVAVDEAFPLYCIAALSLSEASIGTILSVSGVLFAIAQYCTFATLVSQLGLYRATTVGAFLGVPLMTLIPIANVLYHADQRIPAYSVLAILMGLSKVFSCLCFAGLAIMTNRTVPASLRATTNGLSGVGGSVAKAFGPLFAGCLVSLSFSIWGGSLLIWSTIGLLGVTV